MPNLPGLMFALFAALFLLLAAAGVIDLSPRASHTLVSEPGHSRVTAPTP